MSRSRPVLCAIADTAVSKHAFRASAWLAGALESPLVAVHVFDPMGIRTHSRKEMLAAGVDDLDLEQVARVGAEAVLNDVARESPAPKPTTEFVEGRPVPEVLRLAAESLATLLVTGTAGRAGLARLLIGSVASELAAAAPCPVVVVRGGSRLAEPGPVLAGYDGSAHALRAARHAAALAARLRRDVVLVHVADDDQVRVDPSVPDELVAAMSAPAQQADQPAGDPKVELVVEKGDPVAVLSRLARERSAALIFIGSRGRGTIGSALLGSVSPGLVRTAGCPVAIVPATAGGAAECGT